MICYSIIFMLFCIFIRTQAEMQKDRYAVRESDPFGMNCRNKLENITRVRWQYISTTHANTNETIFDSQSNKILKDGFEISCQPHQTFISKCLLRVVRARKEDSGKYICYVGKNSETDSVSDFIKPVFEIELVVRGPKHETMVVNNGDSVILPCEHNVMNLTRARWSHVSLEGVMTYQLYYMDWNEATNNNYKGLCESHQPSCNLKILQANKESAGRYICMVGESLEFEEKYGMDQMTYFIEIQLVVGESFCNENMKKDLTLIGENDCYGIEADVLNLKCSFNYFGNINYNLLHLRWIEKYKFNSLEKKLNSSLINHEVKDETNKISIQTNLSVAYEMQNSIFQCVLDDTAVKPCHLNEFRTQYTRNTTERSPPIHSNDLHNMKCSANKSANVQCSYYWVHEIAGAMVENPYAILPVENMNSPGMYTCIAKCQLGKHKECIVKAMEVEVIRGSKEESHLSNLNIGLIVALVLMALVIVIGLYVFVIRKKFKRKICRKHRRHCSFDDDNSSLQRLTSNEIGEDKKTTDEEIRTGKNDILIYETTQFGKMTSVHSVTKSFEHRAKMHQLLVGCHPHPEHLLIIGKHDELIIEELKKLPKVESLTYETSDQQSSSSPTPTHMTEIQKNGLDFIKHTEKVENILDFLEKHTNSYDVIIITPYQESLEGSGFEKDCKAAESALKKGGIMEVNLKSLVTDDLPSYIAERKIVNLCKEIFPKVVHVIFLGQTSQNIVPAYLFCSLNPNMDFIRPVFKLPCKDHGNQGSSDML